jgi:hypothetical protein
LLQKHGIKIEIEQCENKEKVKAFIPTTWTTKCQGDYVTNYYDENNKIRFYIFEKNEIYDENFYVHFYSEDETNKIYEEECNEIKKKDLFHQKISEVCKKEWDESNRFLIYIYTNGSEKAKRFVGANHFNFLDVCIEFSTHKFIGFVDDIAKFKTIIEILKDNSEYCPWQGELVIRELFNGIQNLHRFEIQHLFGYDPNRDATGMYNQSLFRQKNNSRICDKVAL